MRMSTTGEMKFTGTIHETYKRIKSGGIHWASKETGGLSPDDFVYWYERGEYQFLEDQIANKESTPWDRYQFFLGKSAQWGETLHQWVANGWVDETTWRLSKAGMKHFASKQTGAEFPEWWEEMDWGHAIGESFKEVGQGAKDVVEGAVDTTLDVFQKPILIIGALLLGLYFIKG